jgi:hypothetical protein
VDGALSFTYPDKGDDVKAKKVKETV